MEERREQKAKEHPEETILHNIFHFSYGQRVAQKRRITTFLLPAADSKDYRNYQQPYMVK